METRFKVALPLLVLLSLPVVVEAQFNYTTSNGTITITAYSGYGGAVIIPSAINDLPVTTVAAGAFSTYYYCSLITSLAIPDSVTNFSDGVFYDCIRLTAITLDTHNPVYSSVGGVMFNKDQTKLIQYPFAKSGNYAIPTSVTNIADFAFESCTGLTGVTIPTSVTSVGSLVFFSCTSLTNVNLPSGVASIGRSSFCRTGLSSVTF